MEGSTARTDAERWQQRRRAGDAEERRTASDVGSGSAVSSPSDRERSVTEGVRVGGTPRSPSKSGDFAGEGKAAAFDFEFMDLFWS